MFMLRFSFFTEFRNTLDCYGSQIMDIHAFDSKLTLYVKRQVIIYL